MIRTNWLLVALIVVTLALTGMIIYDHMPSRQLHWSTDLAHHYDPAFANGIFTFQLECVKPAANGQRSVYAVAQYALDFKTGKMVIKKLETALDSFQCPK